MSIADELSHRALAELKARGHTGKRYHRKGFQPVQGIQLSRRQNRIYGWPSRKLTGPSVQRYSETLATASFRQKKIPGGCRGIRQGGRSLFPRPRSLYRAGDKGAFDAVLSELIAREDNRAGYLLNAVAADKRREKDFEGAIKIYRDVLKNYPSDAEDALWGNRVVPVSFPVIMQNQR